MTKKKHLIFILLIISLVFCMGSIASAEELPYLRNVQLKTGIVLNNGVYTYSYSVSNGIASKGDLYSIDIDITSPKGSALLSAEGLTITHGKTVLTFEQEITRKKSLMKVDIVPIGIEKPEGWITGIGISGFIGWGSGDEYEIKPGKILSGFKLISYGIPGIRDCKAEPWLDSDADYYPGWDSVEDAESLKVKVQELIDKVSFKCKTIGPTAPPSDFKPIDFLNYIIGLKHQASSLGWITNKGIENSLDQKLDNAKKKIEQGNITPAKNMLNAFINEVEAQNGKHLTSEAYGLLKYNVQYLIDKLK